MRYIDIDRLEKTAAAKKPFPHLLCPNFVRADALVAVHRDFPDAPGGGSFPLSTLSAGAAFLALIDEMRGDEMARVLADKLDATIVGRPTMVTARGFCRETDGKIHLDSGGKLVTVLLYLNRDWGAAEGGRLRLLNSGNDIDDYFMETPPGDGVMLAFRCDDNAWHGHLPFAGARRSAQLNWVASRSYRRREATRHFLSATVKKARRALFGKRAL